MKPYPVLLTLALLAVPGMAAAAGLGAEAAPTDSSSLPELPVIKSEGGTLATTLQLGYAINHLGPKPNPEDNDVVRLRSYNGQLIGPTLYVRPGETLAVHLVNTLPCLKPPCECQDGPALLHHHVAMGRDALSSVPLPEIFNTTNLHTHGLHVTPKDPGDNVLREVRPGCSRDFRFEIPKDHPAGTFWYHPHVHGATAIQVGSGAVGALIVEGGMDAVPEIAAADDVILLFQQIPYTCAAKARDPKALCTATDTGRVEDFSANFGNGKWPTAWQYTTINGAVQPTIYMAPGEVQRWRTIHGGIRESINLAVVRNLTSPPLAGWLNEIALDGLPTGEIRPLTSAELEPGYRSDLLVKAPKETGDYYLLDLASKAADSLLTEAESQKVLAKIVVRGDLRDMPLPQSAQLARFRLPSVTDDEIKGRPIQKVEFDISGTPTEYKINGKEFPGVTRCLELGKADAWTITSKVASHPFHIHVNPFEVIEPDGRRYFKDTLLVKAGQTLNLRSRYQVFDGPFVLHCHILDHEDRGMMQMVEIVPGPCPKAE